MTTQQLHLFNALYLALFLIVAYVTRAPARRIAGAVAGALVFGVVALGIIALGERAGWWHMAIAWEPYFLTLMLIDFALCAPLFLITWRIARRFGRRGLVVVLAVVAVIGPPRDFWYMRQFPGWGRYGPGVDPLALGPRARRRPVADEDGPGRAEGDQLVGVDRQVAGSQRAAVLEEVAGHPVILARAGEVLHELAEGAAVQLGPPLAGGADE